VPIIVHTNAFDNWPKFERELRRVLEKQLSPEAVQRVIARTQDARERLLLSNLVSSLEPELADHAARYEAWHKDFRAAKMRVLLLIARCSAPSF
jgi:hypothetical protein